MANEQQHRLRAMVVAVPVATVWTSRTAPRVDDQPALTNPVDIATWLAPLTVEQRRALCDDNLVQTQVLFGDTVYVIDEQDDWVQVVVPEQASRKNDLGYPGWIPRVQLGEPPEASGREEKTATIIVPKATLYRESGEPELELSFQTRLPVEKEAGDRVVVRTPSGYRRLEREAVHLANKQDRPPQVSGQAIVESGLQFLGLPYLWGGTSSYGYDCSGFVYTMHRAHGIAIPRDASDQVRSGKPVEPEALQPGDLLFFAYEEGKGRVHHVGLYHGEGRMLHAPMSGDAIEIRALEGTIYEAEHCASRRYW